MTGARFRHTSPCVGTTAVRQRRQPERSVLYGLVSDNLRTFLAQVEAADRVLPLFVVRELEEYLRCGILAHGFCRMHCDRCERDELVAFSCKRRGFCPSCTGRRMADLAAHLVDSVLPDVPYRQWVLSLPFFVRRLCAYDASLCGAVRRVLVRAISGFYLRRKGELSRPRCGSVVFVQRFDSALKLNLHFHGIWADGLFDCPIGGQVDFHALEEVTDVDVSKLVRAIRDRVLRLLRRLDKLPEEGAPADDPAAAAPTLLDELSAAAVQGRTAFGRRRGCQDVRVGRGSLDEPFQRGPLCANVDGFSLHAVRRRARAAPLVDGCQKTDDHAAPESSKAFDLSGS